MSAHTGTDDILLLGRCSRGMLSLFGLGGKEIPPAVASLLTKGEEEAAERRQNSGRLVVCVSAGNQIDQTWQNVHQSSYSSMSK